jgi:hypothetical protein
MSERPEPDGVRFVLSDCGEPGREAELNEWYDAYAADCTRPGLLVNALRYERVGGDGPRYAAVYDIVGDAERAWPETKEHPARQYHASSPLLLVALRATYRRIDPIEPVGDEPLPQAITLVLSDAEERPHGEDATRVTRYELVEGQPDPPRFLEIHESRTPEPPAVSAESARLVGSYVRTFAHP